jgi:hypothetical protein
MNDVGLLAGGDLRSHDPRKREAQETACAQLQLHRARIVSLRRRVPSASSSATAQIAHAELARERQAGQAQRLFVDEEPDDLRALALGQPLLLRAPRGRAATVERDELRRTSPLAAMSGSLAAVRLSPVFFDPPSSSFCSFANRASSSEPCD